MRRGGNAWFHQRASKLRLANRTRPVEQEVEDEPPVRSVRGPEGTIEYWVVDGFRVEVEDIDRVLASRA